MKIKYDLFPRRSYLIAREGWVFIFVFAVITLIAILLNILIAIPFAILTLFTIFFFRNPKRVSPKGEDLIISPADGRIVEVATLVENRFFEGQAKKVSIFMSVFNVHVNRVPFSGTVDNITYHAGKFLVATREKASEANERNEITLDIGKRGKMAVVQIAGFVARRIVCYLIREEGVKRGERLGLIRFGSRVDLYIPSGVDVEVKVGDKVKGGETIIGRFDEK